MLMNKCQKEVQQQFLESEREVLRKLKQGYRTALSGINEKLGQLMGRQGADMQHAIYQAGYQKSLYGGIEGILEKLQSDEFATISAYLAGAYEDGFVGTMYDLQGQGMPLVIPMDREQAAEAARHGTPLSGGLHGTLGKNAGELKRQVAAEISRGIASSLSYADIARNIAAHAGIGRNKAMRIARTEAHRIQCRAAADAQHKARKAGADVVKQWDAALDGRTRKNHRKLDGQTRELDEPFEIDGKKAMHPGGFGRPEEDINCRCALLQRAKWALDEDELEALKERAAYFGLDKAKDFGDFKKKYLKVADDIPSYKANITGGLKKYTEKEVKALTKEMGHIANKHTDIAGKWSGNTIVNDFVNTWGKKWNCDILTKMTTAPIIVLHEQLHARSISLYSRKKGKKIYKAFAKIEEATVQLVAQEICKKENIIIIKSAYDNDVNILRQINEILKIENTDYEFGKQLIKMPVPERIDWLEKKAYNILMKNMKSVSIDNYERVNDLIEELR